ncbi:MAG: TolB family protein [Candidatus Nanoarchaeia archaeon]
MFLENILKNIPGKIGTSLLTGILAISPIACKDYVDISPDGKKAAISTEYKDTIYLVDFSDNSIRQISKEGLPSTSPRFSPDGTKLTYMGEAEDEEDNEIYVTDIRTNETKLYTNDNIEQYFPRWADNKRIVYLQERNGDEDDCSINVLDTETGLIKTLDHGPGVILSYQDIDTRDGRVFYVTIVEEKGDSGFFYLNSSDLDTGSRRVIESFRIVDNVGFIGYDVCVNSNNDVVVGGFVYAEEDNSTPLFIFSNSDGSRNVVYGETGISSPRLSNDGRHVAFNVGKESKTEVAVIDLKDGHRNIVATSTGYHDTPMIGKRWIDGNLHVSIVGGDTLNSLAYNPDTRQVVQRRDISFEHLTD